MVELCELFGGDISRGRRTFSRSHVPNRSSFLNYLDQLILFSNFQEHDNLKKFICFRHHNVDIDKIITDICMIKAFKKFDFVKKLLNIKDFDPKLLIIETRSLLEQVLLDNEDIEIIKLVLPFGNLHSVTTTDLLGKKYFVNPIHFAIKNKSLEQLQLLMKAGSNPNGNQAIPPLIFCLCNSIDLETDVLHSILDILLTQGADVNHVNSLTNYMEEKTSLLKCCEIGDVSIVQKFKKYGANLNLFNANCIHPLIFSIYQNSKNLFTYLLRNGSNVNHKYVDINLNHRYYQFCTPLHIALHTDIVQHTDGYYTESLLRAGANPNQDKNIALPSLLSMLISFKKSEKISIKFVDLLLKYNTNMDTFPYVDEFLITNSAAFKSPLNAALEVKQHALFEYLLKKGADPNDQTKGQFSLLTRCIIESRNDPLIGTVEFANTLLKYGAEPNEVFYHKNIKKNPLNLALGYEQSLLTPAKYELVQILLNHGSLVFFEKHHIKKQRFRKYLHLFPYDLSTTKYLIDILPIFTNLPSNFSAKISYNSIMELFYLQCHANNNF